MRDRHHAESGIMMATNPHGTDGALSRMLRRGQKPKTTPAIFIHAGAGFHSPQNESLHLGACVAAAEMGMKFLKAGATATEAIEASLRILENKDITNAGYGSNLCIDGTVECDATVVDHLGRSGACGAVPGIRNPISLAKMILDMSDKPLSLRRVPPNALVGEGAKAFAEENSMITYSNEHLVSRNARDRFLRWQMDLRRAEDKARDTRALPTADQGLEEWGHFHNDNELSRDISSVSAPQDHAAAIFSSTWNEGQPDASEDEVQDPEFPVDVGRSDALGVGAENIQLERQSRTLQTAQSSETLAHASQADGTRNGSSLSTELIPNCHGVKRPHSQMDDPELVRQSSLDDGKRSLYRAATEDNITDTVGAIAVDEKGRIAAGSSSGGIGMKHRGRLGPAALVGIGTAVVPRIDTEEDGVAVAAVTSGTGEHMVTTMASQRCAERIHQGTRRGPGGVDIQEDNEDSIMESFIAEDFINHPGVKNCHSAAAIGVMAVKQTRSGYYLYFAHNTDSFALASMGGLDKEPVCTMSRLPRGARIARGGRKVRIG